MKQQHLLIPYAAVMLAVLFWGLSFIATKIALESFSPIALIFLRFSMAACFFAAVMVYRGFPKFSRREYGLLLLASLFQPGMYFLCETTGLQYTTASKASLIVATIPIAVLGLSILFLKEQVTGVIITGIILSLMGVVLLIFGDPQVNWTLGGSMVGDLLMFGAVMAMAVYTVLMKNLVEKHSSMTITGLQFFYGTLLFAPAFFWQLPALQWDSITLSSLLALVGLTLFATIGAFVCFNFALSKIPTTQAALFLNCVPVVTAIGAWLVLGEWLTLLQLTGGALVLVSVYLTNFWGERAAKAEVQPLPSLPEKVL